MEVVTSVADEVRAWLGDRPDPVVPASREALAAGAAAVVEIRRQHIPREWFQGLLVEPRVAAGDLADAVLTAAAPYLQLDLLRRIQASNIRNHGWWMLGQVCTVTVALVAAVLFSAVTGALWITALFAAALTVHLVAVLVTFRMNRAQTRVVEQLLMRSGVAQGRFGVGR